ncbi:hypothetical protein HOLleu_21135 [Holothuria leucospilota]|uniref:Amidohydrolase 3 domain-containing protein n=1 Tax=Holothuria leucospilota TaxID=206669 RepID=A0A9Q1BXD5_HOLLE|nr:hypothetical protein HOLleu_21135 [Holothuria leucospilota]
MCTLKMAKKADIIFYGGDIITMDEACTANIEAVAVASGIILAVGTLDEVFTYAGANTQVIYLNQQTLMPGFIECHQHAWACVSVNSAFTVVGAMECRNFAEISSTMKNKLAALEPGCWARFFGWDAELIPDAPTLSAAYLDANFSSTIPILMIGQNGHVAWVNSIGLARLGIDENTENPPGGTIVRDKNGKPTGQLLENIAIHLLIDGDPDQGFDEIYESCKMQWRYYASVGLTTVTDLAYNATEIKDKALKKVADNDDCPVRVAVYHLKSVNESYDEESNAMSSYTEDDSAEKQRRDHDIGNYNGRLWVAGIKLIADGSPHCGTMATKEPYLFTPLTETLCFPKAPGYGNLNMENDALIRTVKHFHTKRKQIAIHAHGDRACEQVLTAYETVFREHGENDNRHRMEHLGLVTKEQLARASKLKLALSFFVDHLRFYGLVYKTDIFGKRVNRWTPLSEATKVGLKWTIHQDHPAFPGKANPFANMKTAITRCTKDDPNTPYGPEYRVSIDEALKAYTINGAWQLHREKDLGSITVGKMADLIVLSKNPYKVDPFDLETINVVESFLEGRRNNFAVTRAIQNSNIAVLQSIKHSPKA